MGSSDYHFKNCLSFSVASEVKSQEIARYDLVKDLIRESRIVISGLSEASSVPFEIHLGESDHFEGSSHILK